eukprot:751378-Hanusia_phi.AAC.2
MSACVEAKEGRTVSETQPNESIPSFYNTPTVLPNPTPGTLPYLIQEYELLSTPHTEGIAQGRLL